MQRACLAQRAFKVWRNYALRDFPCRLPKFRVIFFLAHMRRPDIAGWSSLVARRAHNPEVVGSNPAPATKNLQLGSKIASELFLYRFTLRVNCG